MNKINGIELESSNSFFISQSHPYFIIISWYFRSYLKNILNSCKTLVCLFMSVSLFFLLFFFRLLLYFINCFKLWILYIAIDTYMMMEYLIIIDFSSTVLVISILDQHESRRRKKTCLVIELKVSKANL